jgi:hypothetical protein
VIEQGVDCAVRLLRALHTYAGIDTQQGVSQLLGRWEAVEKVGPFAYDHTVKVQLALFLRESVLGSLTLCTSSGCTCCTRDDRWSWRT